MWTTAPPVRFAARAGACVSCQLSPLIPMPTSPDILWDRDELILVLDLYRKTKSAVPPPGDLTALSRELRTHRERIDGKTPDLKVRSTTGVMDKLAAFDALKHKRPHTRGWSELLEGVWKEFGGEARKTWQAVKLIRDDAPPDAG